MENENALQMENLISENEIEFAVNQLNKDCSPGSDGITTKFYKTFIYLIKTDLVEIYNNCFLQKEMSTTMRQAIIK